MSLFNLALVLLSAVFHSLWNVLTQTSKNSQLFSAVKGVWLIAFSIIFISFIGQPPKVIWLMGFVSGILHALYIFCLSKSYQSLDISYVYPIARSAPIFVPFFAYFFLGEKLSHMSLLGILLIIIAIYFLHFESKLLEGFSNIFHSIFHKDLRWAFLTLGMVVSYSLWDKWSMDIFFHIYPKSAFINSVGFFLLEAGFCFLFYGIYIITNFQKNELISSWKDEWEKGFLGALATMGSYGLICFVLQFSAVSEIVALRQTSVLIVVYWGCWKLKEPFGKQRILAAGLILLGVIFIGSKPDTNV